MVNLKGRTRMAAAIPDEGRLAEEEEEEVWQTPAGARRLGSKVATIVDSALREGWKKTKAPLEVSSKRPYLPLAPTLLQLSPQHKHVGKRISDPVSLEESSPVRRRSRSRSLGSPCSVRTTTSATVKRKGFQRGRRNGFFGSMDTGVQRGRRDGLIGSMDTGAQLGFDVGDILERVVKEDPTNVELQEMMDDTGGQEKNQHIGIHDLIDAGCSIEDISGVIYDVLQDKALPNFLPHVMLDQDGGLDRIDVVWYREKYLWSVLNFLSVVMNYTMLLSMNWSVFASVLYNWEPGLPEHLDTAQVLNTDDVLNNAQQEAIMEAQRDLFRSMTFRAARQRFLVIASIIAMSELLGLFMLIFVAARQLCRFAANGGVTKAHKSEYRAYGAIESFFRETLPLMSTFSAIKLVHAVHPSLLYSHYMNSVEECSCCRGYLGSAGVVRILWFLISRLLLGSIAVMAFGVKLIVISAKLVNPSYSALRTWAEVLALLNNCIGSVRLEQQLQERLFLFMFGGGDAEYQDDERALRNVYRCRVAKQIWTEIWTEKREFLKAVAFLSTFNHYDLQTLLIEDTSVHIASYVRGDARDKSVTCIV